MNRFFSCFFFFFVFFVFGSNAEVVKTTMCAGYENKCTIEEVRVTPCKEAETNKPCRLKKGESGNIAFDFVPDFDSTKLAILPYWASITDLPFIGMDTNACKYTICPVTKGNKQTYAYDLNISKTFASGTYPLKWKVSDDNGSVVCCFRFSIKLF